MWYLRFSRKNGVRSVSSRQRKRCAAAPQDRRGHCASRPARPRFCLAPAARVGWVAAPHAPGAHGVPAADGRGWPAAPSGARLASSCSRCRPRLSCRPGARTAPPKSTLPRPHCVRSATACRHACGAHCSGRHARMAGWAQVQWRARRAGLVAKHREGGVSETFAACGALKSMGNGIREKWSKSVVRLHYVRSCNGWDVRYTGVPSLVRYGEIPCPYASGTISNLTKCFMEIPKIISFM